MKNLIDASLKERVTQKVQSQGLEVDEYKKDFSIRQATQTKVLQENKLKCMQNITQHEKKINDFEKIKTEKEEQIKKLHSSNESLD